jgi:hypothetical protein
MLEVILAILVLLTWWGFLFLLRKGRATTRPEVIVEVTANMKAMADALTRCQVSMQSTTEAMRRFNKAWKEAQLK